MVEAAPEQLCRVALRLDSKSHRLGLPLLLTELLDCIPRHVPTG